MPSITRSKNASGRVPAVVALHCSGAGGYEWRHLTRVLGQRFQLIAPDLIGCGAAAAFAPVRFWSIHVRFCPSLAFATPAIGRAAWAARLGEET